MNCLSRVVGGYFFKIINDQILMFVTMLVYALVTVLTPFFSNIVTLYILGFSGGVVTGMFEIGKTSRMPFVIVRT